MPKSSSQNKAKKQSFSQEALFLHKKFQGKLGVQSLVKVRNKHDLSVVYTPGVAAVSLAVAEDKQKARTLTMKGRTVAIVSDGSAVLGLGNIGPEGALPVMEGKALLFKELAGVDAVPLVIGVHSVEEIVAFVEAAAPGFGGVNLEDIAAPQCFEIEHQLRERLDIPVFHDDQHGTATVVLAGIINALRVVKKTAKNKTVALSGAGAAGIAIAELLKTYEPTLTIYAVDSQGIISQERYAVLNSTKQALLDQGIFSGDRAGGLSEAVQGADIFIGVSQPGVLTGAMIHTMQPEPIIFAMANPTPEIMPEEAYAAGAKVVATGRSDFPNQINNSLVFPGIFRGALDHHVTDITKEMLVKAAKNLANIVKQPTAKRIIPSTFDRRVVPAIARAIR